ncbi:MAG: glycosyltransferase [Bacteroidales bacterium]
MDLSVIIVNYNVRHFLDQCLSSVYRALKDTTGEVIVVDNNSPMALVPWSRKNIRE